MSVASLPVRPAQAPAELPVYRLSVVQYHAMLESGILSHGCHVELLEGLLVEKRDRLRDDDPVIGGEQLPVYRLRVDDYLTMYKHGIVTDETPVELIEGVLVQRFSKSPPHAAARGLLLKALTDVLPAGWILRVQSALQLTDSEPEPDLAVIRGERRDYAIGHPTGADCGLVIEIADASLPIDRGLKRRTYARHSIPEYWFVNLQDDEIEVCTEPSGLVAQPHYRSIQTYSRGDDILIRLDGRELGQIAVNDVLP